MARIILGSLTLGVISFNAFWKFLWLGNSPEEFFGVKFWSREFLGFCLRPKGFLGGTGLPLPWGQRHGTVT